MSAGEALRRAILAEPDEDMPRLVYADWLEENGEPDRAAFIRAQIEAVRADPFGPQVRNAAKRATDLLEAHRANWTRHLRGGFAETPRFERGFVAHLSVEPVAFLPHAEALFEAEPIQALKLYRFAGTGGRASFEALFDLTRLKQLRRLELSSNLLADEEYESLSACSHLAGLRDLSLRDNPVPPSWLEKELRGDRFPEVAGLDLADTPHLGRCLAAALPDASHRELKRVNFSGVVFNSEQIQQLLASRCLRQVEELRLACMTRAEGTGPLFHLDLGYVIRWERLVVLDLAGQRLGNEGVSEIVGQKDAAALRWLGLANNGLGPDAVRQLANSKHFALNYLDVRGNGFTLTALDALHHRFPDAVIVSS